LTGGSDRAIWQHARVHGLAIVSKDEDFHRLSVLYGASPKVIWIRLGSCSTADIIRLLRERRSEIDRFMADEETTLSCARVRIEQQGNSLPNRLSLGRRRQPPGRDGPLQQMLLDGDQG